METPAGVECDGCGRDCGGGSLNDAWRIARITSTGQAEILHLCVQTEEGKNGEQKQKGCGPSAITPARTKAYTERRDAAGDREQPSGSDPTVAALGERLGDPNSGREAHAGDRARGRAREKQRSAVRARRAAREAK